MTSTVRLATPDERAALRATLRPAGADADVATSSTLLASRDGGPAPSDTVVDGAGPAHAATGAGAPASASATGGVLRTTVLPRRAAPDVDGGPRVDDRPRFEVLGVLGRGAVGEVRLVRDHDIEREVAVKRLLPRARTGEALLRFADEVRAIGQLEHPGIVPIYDVGVEPDGSHYLVMKRVEGETLEAVIERLRAGDPAYRQRFSMADRAHLFLGVLQAVRYAHERGLVHRDLKPANIMVGPFGEVTVMDWGLAKRIGGAEPAASSGSASSPHGSAAQTQQGALLGTPLYMSPEQAAGEHDRLDGRSDVFSLCLVFYELVTLHHPLEDATSVAEVVARLVGEPLDGWAMQKRGLAAGAPVEYLQFAEAGLAYDRAGRYPSVAAMEQRLRALMDGRFAVRCHVSLGKQAAHGFLRWVDRHPMAYTAVLGGVTLAVVAAIALGVAALL